MAIYRSSDSLSRCDPSLYSNIYDVRKRSDLNQEALAKTPPIQKDTIEISRDKLKGEALSRLRHTSKYVLAQNSFMRIGKYLFLAVAFPPYFLIYGLPKWVLVEGIPSIYSFLVLMWKSVENQTHQKIEAGKNKIVQMVHFVQRMGQVLMQPIVHGVLKMRSEVRRRRDQAVQFIKHHWGRAAAVFFTPYSNGVEKVKRAFKRLSEVKEKWAENAQAAIKRMEETIQWVKNSPQLFLGWGQAQLQRFNRQMSGFGLRGRNGFQASQEWAQRATDWVYSKFKTPIESMKSRVAPVIQLCQEFQLRLKKLSESCKGKWKQTRDFFHQRHQRALAFLEKRQEKLKQLSSQRFIHDLISRSWMGKLPSRLQQVLKGWLMHPMTQAIFHRAIQIYAFFAYYLLQMVKYGLMVVGQCAAFGMRVCNAIHTLLEHGFNYVWKGLRLVRRGLKLSLYYFLLFLMIAFILFVWGMRHLGHRMNALTSAHK